MNHRAVKQFLEALRGDSTAKREPQLGLESSAAPIIEEVFSMGNCGNLAVMSSLAFSGKPVEVYRQVGDHMSPVHFVCEIDGRLYDITGDVTDKYKADRLEHRPLNYVIRESSMYDNYAFDIRGPCI